MVDNTWRDAKCVSNKLTFGSGELKSKYYKFSYSAYKIRVFSLFEQNHITKICPRNIQRFFSAIKVENFSRKSLIFLKLFAQNIDQRGSSNEYQQSMFWTKNKKNRFAPAYPSFTI